MMWWTTLVNFKKKRIVEEFIETFMFYKNTSYVQQSPVLRKHIEPVYQKCDEKWTMPFELRPFTIITVFRLFGLSAGPN